MTSFWSKYAQSIAEALRSVQVTDGGGATLDYDRALEQLCEWTAALRTSEGMLHLAGNGASASMSSHLAADWSKNVGVRAYAYNDFAFLTAISNDIGYDQVFAGPLTWYARPGDLLAAISSSGNSPNIIRAIEAAKAKRCRVVTFSGMKPDNAARRLGDLNVFVPALTYGIVESAHQVLLHAWLDRFMNVREWDATERQTPPPR